ncbi:MAG: trehalose-phosphatase [Actinobacteria bacterium]|nr:trehalose-phosphatase [Actinomycetota bacterium]
MPGAGGAPGIDPLAVLRADPAETAIFTDFDGTLSEIVADPAAARPVDGALAVLAGLAERYAVVGVISGRPLDFLAAHLPDSLHLAGLYGIETSHRGRRVEHESVGAWREAVADIITSAEVRRPAGARVEDKGLSVTLHYRGRPDLAAAVRSWAEGLAARSGLQVREARQSFELHPPVDVDKGTVVERLASDLSAACFFGDDAGDLGAFDALDRLASRGVATVRVAVRSAEAPDELLQRADVIVDGPEAAVELLGSLIV